MAEKMVEVVIKIPETLKTNIDNGHFWGSATIFEAIQRGTIIPKGHGRLIDADAATKDVNAFIRAFAMYTDNMGKYNIVCTAPTVIEADKDGDTD